MHRPLAHRGSLRCKAVQAAAADIAAAASAGASIYANPGVGASGASGAVASRREA